jgi:preprotein translocase subunit YajC
MKRTLLFIFSLLISSQAMAEAAPASSSGGDVASLVFQLLIIFAIFYFLLIRPQQKKLKEHQEMTKTLSKGNKVVTSGGIIGVISKAQEGEKTIELEIAKGVKVDVVRSTVNEVLEEKGKIKKDSEVVDEKTDKSKKTKAKSSAKAKTSGKKTTSKTKSTKSKKDAD